MIHLTTAEMINTLDTYNLHAGKAGLAYAQLRGLIHEAAAEYAAEQATDAPSYALAYKEAVEALEADLF